MTYYQFGQCADCGSVEACEFSDYDLKSKYGLCPGCKIAHNMCSEARVTALLAARNAYEAKERLLSG